MSDATKATRYAEQDIHPASPKPWHPTIGIGFHGVTNAEGNPVCTLILNRADAHLLAAAPDLLAALQEFLDTADGHDDFEPALWINTRAAIAKATGASS